MKTLILAALALVAVTAQADIRRPPRPAEYTVKNYVGNTAKKMYESIKSEPQIGDALRTYTSVYKVERLNGGKVQNICFKFIDSFNKKTTYNCEIWTSTSSRPVPHYVFRRRMG